MMRPVFFSFTVIIWLPGVCATQRLTTTEPVAEQVQVADDDVLDVVGRQADFSSVARRLATPGSSRV